MFPMTHEAGMKIVAAIERLAVAQERIATVLEDEAKIGGAFDGIRGVSRAINALAVEVSALPGGGK
jgi:hypothetical protein